MNNNRGQGVAHCIFVEEKVLGLVQSVKELLNLCNQQRRDIIELRREMSDKVGKATFQAALLSKASKSLTERELQAFRLEMELEVKKHFDAIATSEVVIGGEAERLADRAQLKNLADEIEDLKDNHTTFIQREVNRHAALVKKQVNAHEEAIKGMEMSISNVDHRTMNLERAGVRRNNILHLSNMASLKIRNPNLLQQNVRSYSPVIPPSKDMNSNKGISHDAAAQVQQAGVVVRKTLDDLYTVRLDNGEEVVVQGFKLRAIRDPVVELMDISTGSAATFGPEICIGARVQFQGKTRSRSNSAHVSFKNLSRRQASSPIRQDAERPISQESKVKSAERPLTNAIGFRLSEGSEFSDTNQEENMAPLVQLGVTTGRRQLENRESTDFDPSDEEAVFLEVTKRLHDVEGNISANQQKNEMLHAQMKIMETHHLRLNDENEQIHKAQSALKEQLNVVESTLSQLGTQIVDLLQSENEKLAKNEQMISVLKARIDKTEGKGKDVSRELKNFKEEFQKIMGKVAYKLRSKSRNERVDDGQDGDSWWCLETSPDQSSLVQPIADQARNLKSALDAALQELARQQVQNKTYVEAYSSLIEEVRVLHETQAMLRETLQSRQEFPPVHFPAVSKPTTEPLVRKSSASRPSPPRVPRGYGLESYPETDTQQLHSVINTISQDLNNLALKPDRDNPAVVDNWKKKTGGKDTQMAGLKKQLLKKYPQCSNKKKADLKPKSARTLSATFGGWTPAVPSDTPPPDSALLTASSSFSRPSSNKSDTRPENGGRSFKLASLPGMETQWAVSTDNHNNDSVGSVSPLPNILQNVDASTDAPKITTARF